MQEVKQASEGMQSGFKLTIYVSISPKYGVSGPTKRTDVLQKIYLLSHWFSFIIIYLTFDTDIITCILYLKLRFKLKTGKQIHPQTQSLIPLHEDIPLCSVHM